MKHDNTVTWLASWTENVQGQVKYVMLNPSSRLKGEKDWQKYEKARKLKGEIDKIREEYMADLKSKEMRIRQRAVALYFIDKLALRAGIVSTVNCNPVALSSEPQFVLAQVTRRTRTRRTPWAAAVSGWSTSSCTTRRARTSSWWSLTSWVKTPLGGCDSCNCL